MSVNDFNFVPYLKEQVTEKLQSKWPTCTELRERLDEPKCEYLIHMVTANKKGSHKNIKISISVIGEQARTPFHSVNTLFQINMGDSGRHTFHIIDVSVGQFTCLKICRHDAPLTGDWFIKYVIVTTPYNGKCYTLPVHRWLSAEYPMLALKDGKGVPYSTNSKYLNRLDTISQYQAQQHYSWYVVPEEEAETDLKQLGQHAAGMDSALLPREERLEDEPQLIKKWQNVISKPNAVVAVVSSTLMKFRGLKFFEEYAYLVSDQTEKNPILKHVISAWHSDEEFGRQLLNGTNPTKLTRVTAVSPKFPVKNEMVVTMLKTGRTLEQEIDAGRIYMLSYPELEEIATDITEGQQRFLCAPHCLLYVRDNKLVPIAIQLHQKANEFAPIYTPSDDSVGEYSDWLIAKMWVRVADNNYHQAIVNYLGTYRVLEPIATAVWRQLPISHPVHKILRAHLAGAVSANVFARKWVTAYQAGMGQSLAVAEKKGVLQHLLLKQCQDAKVFFMPFPETLQVRGVEDADTLPGYCYRDDGTLLWEAIHLYVNEVLRYFYEEMRFDLGRDQRLKDFLEDLGDNGFPGDVEFPREFYSMNHLVDFISAIIFRATCHRAMVCGPQKDFYLFMPNAPPCLMMPPPTSKHAFGWKEEEMRKLMPTRDICLNQIDLANAFSDAVASQARLGDNQEKVFTEEVPLTALKTFQTRLTNFAKVIRQRNTILDCPYGYLLPENIPNSLTI